MQRVGYSGARGLMLASLLVLVLGVAGVLLMGGVGSGPAPWLTAPIQEAPVLAVPAAAAVASARPTELGQPVVGSQVAAEVNWIDVNSAASGIELTLRLRNLRPEDLAFAFEPSQALSLADVAGHRYRLEWAEYDGQLRIPASGEVQLVRAFFVGPRDSFPADRLLLGLRGVPGLGDAQFDLRPPQPPASPLGADDAVRGFGLALHLASTKADLAAGTVEVAFSVADVGHAGPDELPFSFSPWRDLTLTDAAGHRYSLEWAEYDGLVMLKAGQQRQLVRAHFRGPVEQAKALFVGVRNLPRIGGGTWVVPVQPTAPASGPFGSADVAAPRLYGKERTNS